MWWMAVAQKGKEKGQGAAKMAFPKAKKAPTYEPDQNLALSMNKPAAPEAAGEDEFSDEERRKKRLNAEY